jgi:hypothetical protein
VAKSRSVGRLVSLAHYKAARHACNVLLGLLHEPPFLKWARVRVRADGTAEIAVAADEWTEERRVVLPCHVNGIEIVPLELKSPPHTLLPKGNR